MAEEEVMDMASHFKNCNLNENMINSYDLNKYIEILELVEDHGLDVDSVDNVEQAQNLLFKHLKEKNKLTNDGMRTDVVQQVVEDHHERRKTLLRSAQDVQNFILQLPAKRKKEIKTYFPNIDRELIENIKQLEDQRCSFIVAGETGSGKSCFLNLLMGHLDQNFLPVKNVPSTSCMCEVMYGEKGQISAYLENSDTPEISEELTEANMTEMLSKYTHQKEDRDIIKYTKVVVQWPLSWLKSGLTIIDSPGVGERPEITELVKQMMPTAFGFIYVVNTTKAGGIQAGELEDLLLGSNSKDSSESFDPRTAIFIFNKWDLIDNAERQKVKDAVRKKLENQVWKGIDSENQTFFLSTTQATSALKIEPDGYITEEYSRVLKGIERLMEFSMRSKMKKHYNYLIEVLSRVIFILKAYLGSYDEINKNYHRIKSRLDSLENSSVEIQRLLKRTLKDEIEHIVHTLKRHLDSDKTKERLCRWHEGDCPKEYGGVHVWQGLARQSRVMAHERVMGEIKRWEKENSVMEAANNKLLKVFQTHFMSLKDQLFVIENDFIGDVDDKQLKNLISEVKHDVFSDDEVNLTTTDKVILGVTAPLWVPITVVVGLIATPFIIGWAIRSAMKEDRKEAAYYQGYINRGTEALPELLAIETESYMSRVIKGDLLSSLIGESMNGLMKKFLVLINKIPDFVAADKVLLSNMKADMEEGINTETRSLCRELLVKVQKLQRNLDYFYILHIHENDINPTDLVMGNKIGEGSFGDVFKAKLKTKVGSITVAAKKLKVELTPYHASDLRIEHSNMRKIQSENTVKYFGMCFKEDETEKKVPIMIMQLCEYSLEKIIYDPSKYTPPGTLTPSDSKRAKATEVMVDYALQISNGLQIMHKIGMVHRDVKPANILVEVNPRNTKSQHVLKLCDFGLTKAEEMIGQTLCGTPLYAAPEVMGGKHYDRSTDIFSFGIIVIELFYGKLVCNIPFIDFDYPPTKIGGNPFTVNAPPEEWVKFICPCWSVVPKTRPSAQSCYRFFHTCANPKPKIPPKKPKNVVAQLLKRH